MTELSMQDLAHQTSLVSNQTSQYGSMTRLRKIPDAMQADLDGAKEQIKTAHRDDRLSQAARMGDIASAKKDALGSLDRRAAEARSLAADVQDEMGRITKGHEKNAADGLDQVRAQRYWDRTRNALGRGKSPLQVIQEASGPTELQTLAEELPDHLEASGMDSRTADGLMGMVHEQRLSSAPPHVQEAHALADEARFLGDALGYRHGLFRQRLQSGAVDEEAKRELISEGGYTHRGIEPPPVVEGRNPAMFDRR